MIVTGLFVAGFIGIMIFATPLLAYLIVFTVHLLLSAATGFGTIGGGGEANMHGLLTPGDILFNKVPLTSIDFFNFTNQGGTMEVIRNIIAEWFVILVGISLILLLIVLVYIAIRVLISTAKDKSKYKEALTNWVVSVMLLFLIQGYAALIIKTNNFFIDVISKSISKYSEVNFAMAQESFSLNPLTWIASVIIYGMFVRYTAIFLFQYIKRMIKIAFLIMIAPLITVTYSIDKYADKKAQALSSWMTQFTSEVLIQPFHALIYLILLSLAQALAKTNLASGIVAIVIFKFMFEAEKIVKTIFGVKPSASMKDGQKVTSAIVNSQIVKMGIDKIKKMPTYTNKPEVSEIGKFQNVKDKTKPDELEAAYKNEDKENALPDEVGLDNQEDVDNDQEQEELDIPVNTNGKVDEDDEDIEEVETTLHEEEKTEKVEEQTEKEETKELTEEEKKKLQKQKIEEQRKKVLSAYKHDLLPFSFALATASLEAADEGDSVVKNLVQGGVLGYGIGKGIDNKLTYEMDKRKTKKLQADHYEDNVKLTSKEMAKNSAVYMALKGIDVDTTSEEGQKILLDWIENMESKDAKSLSETFEANKQKLINTYVKRDNISEIEAISKVNSLEEEMLALGSDMNVNEYTKDERDYLASMIEVKARAEKTEIESWTNEVDPNVMDVVKATVLDEYKKKNVEYVKPTEIKENSDYSTINKNTQKLDDNYVEQIRKKDKRMNELYNEYEAAKDDYETKYNKTKEAIEKELKDDKKSIEDFKKEHERALREMATKKHDIKKAFETDYELDPKAFKIDDKIESEAAKKIIAENPKSEEKKQDTNAQNNKDNQNKNDNSNKNDLNNDSNKNE